MISLTYDEQAIGNYLEQEVPNQPVRQTSPQERRRQQRHGAATIVKGVDGQRSERVRPSL